MRNPRSLLLLSALALAACSDTGDPLLQPRDDGPAEVPSLTISLTCTAVIQSGTVTCGSTAPGVSGGASAVILGGQHQYMTLTSSNAAFVADTFGVDVTVTNLIPQPLGTTNGVSSDPGGVRVFFVSGPTSKSGGVVTVANADGTGVFTGPDQPYHQYNGILPQDSTSPVKRWKFHVTPEVTGFTFVVLVSAAVQYPDGYIQDTPYVLSLDPNEVRTLGGTVYNYRGDVLAGEVISWSSDAPGTAAVTGNQVTAGGARGFATLTATNGPRSGIYTTAVSVCQSVVVANGTSLPSSISSSDCFSSYGSNSGRPTTSYYADLFRVALTAGQTITVTMDSGDDLDTYLLLAGPTNGFLVAGNDDDDEGSLGVGSRVVYTATVSGVYVIEASTFNGLDTGNYTLGVTIS
jgi:hypothetical protein